MNDLRSLRSSIWVLYGIAATGLLGINGVFLYFAFFQPDVMMEAFRNPVSVAFIAEAFLLMGVAAWLVAKTGWQRPGWRAFVVLSIVGSLAFSVPVFLLMHLRKQRRETVVG